MNACRFQNQISLYLDGELTGDRLAAFEAHLEQCAQCREEVEQYRGLLRVLGGMEQREVPQELREKLHVALIQETERGNGRVRRKINPWVLPAAAAVCVCLVGGALLIGGALGLVTDNQNRTSTQNAVLTKDENTYGAAAPETAKGQFNAAAVPAASAAPQASAAAAAPGDNRVAGDLALAGEPEAGQGADAGQAQTFADSGRKLIYNASFTLETRQFDARLADLDAIVAKYGGYVEQSQAGGVPEDAVGTAGRNATVVLRLPVEQYGNAKKDILALGNPLGESETTEDVSRQYVDTEARNKTLKLQRDRLYELLAKADSMDSVIALENEIARLTTEIEQMTAQLKFWDDKVAYSTVTVELRELVTPRQVQPADPDLGSRMRGALYRSLSNLKKGAENFAVGFMGALPVLILILVLGGALVAILVPVARKAKRNKNTEPPKEE